jgi:hypothetical protein
MSLRKQLLKIQKYIEKIKINAWQMKGVANETLRIASSDEI